MNGFGDVAALPGALGSLLVAALLLGVSGVPGLLLPWRSPWGPRLATLLALAGSLLGAGGAVVGLHPGGATFAFPSPLPALRATVGIDPLTACFSLPVFVVGGLGALYGFASWPPHRHPRHGRRLRFCYGLLLAALVLITLARDGVTFLVGWEVMALANFFLVTTEDDDGAVRRAGWLYLLYSHAAVLALFALFVLAQQATGDFAFAVVPAVAPAGLRTAIFVLALVAFGIKAGMVPLHSWLPPAHASAPSHVSALMSGVVIKMGIYGLLRITSLLAAPPPAWGVAVLVLGALSAFLGVVFAIAQHDLKRLLAYHSVENIGIILLGLGLALLGQSAGRPAWVVLGLGGCLLHVWNHALFKSLLFLGAGSVLHASGSRELERLGGLARRLPVTAGLFLLGAVAICGLPPLNGLVSELFVYLGLLRTSSEPGWAWVALAVPVLASTGALAVACFVKVYGIVFLGTARSAGAARAHEPARLMLAPMAALAAGCLAIGVAPALVAPALEPAIADWSGRPLGADALQRLAPLGWISIAAFSLLAAVLLIGLAVLPVYRRARRRAPALPTWDCGYAASSPRLQYTASSFAQLITSRFAWVLRPRLRRPRIEGPFPAPARFHVHVGDPLLEGLAAPASRAAMNAAAALRALPRGQLQRYILYVLAVLVPLLVWAVAGGGGGR
jgi:hydrogenase-4 component B